MTLIVTSRFDCSSELNAGQTEGFPSSSIAAQLPRYTPSRTDLLQINGPVHRMKLRGLHSERTRGRDIGRELSFRTGIAVVSGLDLWCWEGDVDGHRRDSSGGVLSSHGRWFYL